jgi:hypothetical protein
MLLVVECSVTPFYECLPFPMYYLTDCRGWKEEEREAAIIHFELKFQHLPEGVEELLRDYLTCQQFGYNTGLQNTLHIMYLQ